MRRTQQMLTVAEALMAAPRDRHWGYELHKQTGLRSGLLYPILQRMLDSEWLTDSWESIAELHGEKRPPRRYYTLTELGIAELGAMPAPARRQARAGRPALAGGLG